MWAGIRSREEGDSPSLRRPLDSSRPLVVDDEDNAAAVAYAAAAGNASILPRKTEGTATR